MFAISFTRKNVQQVYKMLYLFFLIICLNIEITWGEYAPVVRTNSGMVRGIVLTDKQNGKRVHLYKGIKYGK